MEIFNKRPNKKYIKNIEFYKGITIIRLSGDITVDNIQTAREEFALLTKNKDVKNVLFDLKNVSDADSSGVAALVDLFRYMKENKVGEKIGLINLSEKISNLLQFTKTYDLFNEYSTEQDAIENLK